MLEWRLSWLLLLAAELLTFGWAEPPQVHSNPNVGRRRNQYNHQERRDNVVPNSQQYSSPSTGSIESSYLSRDNILRTNASFKLSKSNFLLRVPSSPVRINVNIMNPYQSIPNDAYASDTKTLHLALRQRDSKRKSQRRGNPENVRRSKPHRSNLSGALPFSSNQIIRILRQSQSRNSYIPLTAVRTPERKIIVRDNTKSPNLYRRSDRNSSSLSLYSTIMAGLRRLPVLGNVLKANVDPMYRPILNSILPVAEDSE